MSAGASFDVAKVPASMGPSRAVTAREVRAGIERARLRVAAQLDALEITLSPALRIRAALRNAVRRHPVLTLGGALLAGYGLARLLFRR